MAKAKKQVKKPAQKVLPLQDQIDRIGHFTNRLDERISLIDGWIDATDDQIETAERQIDELKEAICPRVAARLTALEKQQSTDDLRLTTASALTEITARIVRLETLSRTPADPIPQGTNTTPSKADRPALVLSIARRIAARSGFHWSQAPLPMQEDLLRQTQEIIRIIEAA
jgi:chromosome segregation ATPase